MPDRLHKYAVDPIPARFYIGAMDGSDPKRLINQFSALELDARELVALCNRLTEENQGLRRQNQQLIAERAALLEKNEQARNRIEAMIARLKSMEHSQ